MNEISLFLGEISFSIKGDPGYISLLKTRFRPFFTSNSCTDVLFQITSLADDEIEMSPLSEEERYLYSEFIFSQFLGPGLLAVPFISPDNKETDGTHYNNIENCFDVPLFGAEKVRTSLAKCHHHAKDVVLSLHAFSITIRDYCNASTHLFYSQECFEIIKRSDPNELIRRLFVSFFPKFSSLLIHSSCIIHNKRAALFLAQDGGGKSTAVEMALKNYPDGVVPSDDRIVIKKKGQEFFAYGSPWGNMVDAEASGQISALFLLRKSDSFKLEKINEQEAIEHIWKDHQYDRVFLPKELKTKYFELVVELCRRVGVYRLEFQKDYIDWDAVDRAMEGTIA